MLVSIIDLDSVTHDVTTSLQAIGDGALLWPELRMAAVRDATMLPISVRSALTSAPREVNRDRWAIVDGLDRVLEQARLHRQTVIPNGNAALAAVAGGSIDAYPAFDAEGRLFTASERPTALGWLGAINVSIGAGAPGPFDPGDPVNIAIRRAAEVAPVVMAAGNARDLRRGPAAFSKWAKSPWVIAVTALRDGVLADDSAFGDPNASFGPAVAAPDDRVTIYYPVTDTVEAHRGTSFAAPVVTRQLVKLTALSLTVRAAVHEAGGRVTGIPRVGFGLIDKGIRPDELEAPSWPHGALPMVGIAVDGARQLARVAEDTGLAADATPQPSALRRMLSTSARPVEGHGPHQVGAGEISDGTTAIYASRLTGGAYLRALLGDSEGVEDAARRLDDVPLTDSTLPVALQVWDQAAFGWLWDFRVAHQLYGLTFLTKEGRPA